MDAPAVAIAHHAAAVLKNLQTKAAHARVTAYVHFGLTMLVALGIFAMFLYSKQIDVGSRIIEDSNVNGVKTVNQRIIENDLLGAVMNSAVVRIGAVLVGIFLIQILVGFCRYYFRLAEHLSACAEIVLLSQGDPKKMTALATVMLPNFDFGKVPSSPFQKIVESSMETVREPTKRIPAK